MSEQVATPETTEAAVGNIDLRDVLRDIVSEAVDKETLSTVVESELARARAAAADTARTPIVKVTADRSVDDSGLWSSTYSLLRSIVLRNDGEIAKTQHKLARAGHYGEERRAESMKMNPESRAVMLTSAEGAPFLPTSVLNSVEDIMQDYGVARQVCTVLTGLRGSTKVPRISGRFDAFAVNEAAAIKARKANFAVSTLDPEKWGVLVPFTAEMEIEVGAQLTQIIMILAGEAFARAEDQTVFIADGTATYHSLTGLLESGTIGEHILAATNTSFANLAWEDLIDMRGAVDPGARGPQSAYVFHHDVEDILAKMQDGQGRYIFGDGQGGTRITRIQGRPVYYTEAMPDISADAISTSFGLFGDFRLVTIGFQRDLQAKLLTEATILDPADDTTPFYLATQDAMAIRLIASWDVVYGLVNGFSKVTTAAA